MLYDTTSETPMLSPIHILDTRILVRRPHHRYYAGTSNTLYVLRISCVLVMPVYQLLCVFYVSRVYRQRCTKLVWASLQLPHSYHLGGGFMRVPDRISSVQCFEVDARRPVARGRYRAIYLCQHLRWITVTIVNRS